jgi:hypothetical protein
MNGIRSMLFATVMMSAFQAVTWTQIPVTAGAALADATASNVVGSYGPTASPTGNATTNYTRFELGSFQAGTSIRIGTCGMAGATFERNTFLRLLVATTTVELASNDDNCERSGLGPTPSTW